MKRKPGSLVPLEVLILEAGVEMAPRGTPYFHGFLIAQKIKDQERPACSPLVAPSTGLSTACRKRDCSRVIGRTRPKQPRTAVRDGGYTG